MGFGEAIASVYRNYANFRGRARRSEYWFFALFWVIVVLGLCVVYVLLATTGSRDMQLPEPGYGHSGAEFLQMGFVGLALLVLLLGNIIPSLAVSVRRLHDLNASGWWLLLFMVVGLIPLIGSLVTLGQIVWFCMPGTAGDNQYGPDPKVAG